jgi:hypothetical protein
MELEQSDRRSPVPPDRLLKLRFAEQFIEMQGKSGPRVALTIF